MNLEDDPLKVITDEQGLSAEPQQVPRDDISKIKMLLLGARIAAEIIVVEPIINKLQKRKPSRSRSAWLDY